jgi:outer membrane receptor protein involved in Fe transport
MNETNEQTQQPAQFEQQQQSAQTEQVIQEQKVGTHSDELDVAGTLIIKFMHKIFYFFKPHSNSQE